MGGVPRMLITFLQSEACSQGPSNVSPRALCEIRSPVLTHTPHRPSQLVLCAVSSRGWVTWRKRGSCCCAQGCREPPPPHPRAFLYFIHGNSQVERTPGMIPSFYLIFWPQELLTTSPRMNNCGKPWMEATDPGSRDKGGGCHQGEKPPPYPLTSRYAMKSIVIFALNSQLYFK